MLTWFNGASIVIFFVFLLFLIMIIKCCVDAQRRPRKVMRRRQNGNSFENIPQETLANAPPGEILTEIETDVDAVLLTDSNAGKCTWDKLFVANARRRGDAGTNIRLFQMISASPVVVPPYPVEPRHPTPHAGPPAPGFATHNPPYPTHNPHPTPGALPTPYPPAAAAPYPSATPYPPPGGSSAPYPDYSAQPPSYSEAVSQPSLPVKDGYSKQAPYNPNY